MGPKLSVFVYLGEKIFGFWGDKSYQTKGNKVEEPPKSELFFFFSPLLGPGLKMDGGVTKGFLAPLKKKGAPAPSSKNFLGGPDPFWFPPPFSPETPRGAFPIDFPPLFTSGPPTFCGECGPGPPPLPFPPPIGPGKNFGPGFSHCIVPLSFS